MADYVVGIDQGTSGSRALVLDREGRPCGYGYRPLARIYPCPGEVEQNPWEVALTVREALALALNDGGLRSSDIAAIGIASQRDTDFVWDAQSGLPLANAITWQDLRTQPLEDSFREHALAADARHRLGYWPGPYSAALHLKWRMAHDARVREAAQSERLRIGLSANWLMQAMGKPAGHVTDVSLAQSMCLWDYHAQEYWAPWLDWLGVPVRALPRALPTVSDFGTLFVDGRAIPVRALIGDQQGALFGYDCWERGEAEATHGTSSFVNVNVGAEAPTLDTIKVYLAWLLDDRPTYCLEADTTVSGAAVRWLRENLGLIETDEALSTLAASVADSGGVAFVPALTGLNVPYNDRDARGSLLGLTLGHTRAHVARAFFDSLGFQLRAILDEIALKAGISVTTLKVGGGLSASDLACQIQADWLGMPVVRPRFAQTTARAAALLAGLGVGFWRSQHELPRLASEATVFEPRLDVDAREAGFARWQRAVRTVREWGAS
ncbi:MAG TPA: FGGY-family carbohydrate kinase [Anaerolineales bacterium]|nr:FGGY-family carbohydrate kinase [Anaerolineales bacterium]